MSNSYNSSYSARRLMGSRRIVDSAAYCNQILLAQICINSTQNTSVNWIIRLLLSLSCRPKVILLSGGHCISECVSSLSPSTLKSHMKWSALNWLRKSNSMCIQLMTPSKSEAPPWIRNEHQLLHILVTEQAITNLRYL